MSEKQPHLNGAYYGPAVPPHEQRRTYHRPGRGGDCCGCGCCCGCLLDCICGCICQLLCTLFILIGLVVLVLWFVFRPNKIQFHVTDASLTRFDYVNHTLHYNLALNVTIRNPNRRIGIYYDSLEANAFFEDERFSTQALAPFYQGHKDTHVLSPAFRGQQSLLLSSDGVSHFNEDKSSGAFDIQLKLFLRIRFKVWIFKTGKFKPKMDCDLKVPLTTNGTTSGQFEATACHLDF